MSRVSSPTVSLEEEEATTSEDVHTQTNPYCGDLTCWCHFKVEYHDEVTNPQPLEEEIEQAYSFLALPRR